MWVIFLYLLKNSFTVLVGLLISYALIIFNHYFRISTLSFNEYYLHFFKNDFLNIIILFIIYFLMYFIFSLFNYLITSYTITNYYSFIIGLVFSSFHAYILFANNVAVDIESFASMISIQIFLSFFINYSTKYEKGNKTLIKDTF